MEGHVIDIAKCSESVAAFLEVTPVLNRKPKHKSARQLVLASTGAGASRSGIQETAVLDEDVATVFMSR
jgi:hypothetical protein